MTDREEANWCSVEPFDTLDQCLNHIRETHLQELIRCIGKDTKTGELHEQELPSHIFRGEVGWFNECTSRRERVRRGDFANVEEAALEPIGKDVDQSLQSQLQLDQMLSAGLMQHYGWPTEFIDATASLSTAAFFARWGANRDQQRDRQGSIAVFDVKTLIKSSIVVELRQCRLSVRAERQEAFGIWHSQHRDLKQPQAISDMGITWYKFREDPCHDSRVDGGRNLLSVSDDQVAGFLRLWLDSSIEQRGKVCHSVAMYLAERIAHCPLVGRVTEWDSAARPKEMCLITPSEAGIAVKEAEEIKTSLKLWSRNHLDFVKRPPLEEVTNRGQDA